MITEDQLEQLCLKWFQSIGYDTTCGYDIAPDGDSQERSSGRGTVYFLPASSDEALEVSSGGLEASSGGLEVSSGGLAGLDVIAAEVAGKKKAPKSVVESTILRLCHERALTLDELSTLLNRSVDCIRKDYLQPMIRDRRLRYRYPTSPQHPEQAYIANEERTSE